jgi:hypothetical protein
MKKVKGRKANPTINRLSCGLTAPTTVKLEFEFVFFESDTAVVGDLEINQLEHVR